MAGQEQQSSGRAWAASDAELVEQSFTEPYVFAALFDRHAAAIYRYAARRVEPMTSSPTRS